MFRDTRPGVGGGEVGGATREVGGACWSAFSLASRNSLSHSSRIRGEGKIREYCCGEVLRGGGREGGEGGREGRKGGEGGRKGGEEGRKGREGGGETEEKENNEVIGIMGAVPDISTAPHTLRLD